MPSNRNVLDRVRLLVSPRECGREETNPHRNDRTQNETVCLLGNHKGQSVRSEMKGYGDEKNRIEKRIFL